jgi:hypothetical protein
MTAELERVSQCLEEALTAFSSGQSDDGCRHLEEATSILDTIAAPPETMFAAAAIQEAQEALPEPEPVRLRAMAMAA